MRVLLVCRTGAIESRNRDRGQDFLGLERCRQQVNEQVIRIDFPIAIWTSH